MAKTLDDIFNEDDFGLLDSNERTSVIKTDEDRLLESFEEINSFFEKNKREPSTSSIAEYSLLARLKEFRNNQKNFEYDYEEDPYEPSYDSYEY